MIDKKKQEFYNCFFNAHESAFDNVLSRCRKPDGEIDWDFYAKILDALKGFGPDQIVNINKSGLFH